MVRKINTSGVITLFAGTVGSLSFYGDGGQATAAKFHNPTGLAMDAAGNLYVADDDNYRVREIYLVLNVSATVTANVSCYGGNNGSASSTVSHGTAPYTYLWTSSITATNSTATNLSAGTYTVTVTDADGVKGTASVTISQPGAVPTPTLVALSSDSVAFRATTYIGDTLSYSWTLSDMTGSYSGPGDTANIPVEPRNATLTYTATTPTNGCTAFTSLYVAHHFDLPATQKPYPRWSKRGLYIEWTAYYIDSTYIYTSYNKITPLVTYCRNNHISYVCLGGLQYDPGDTGWVFGISDYWVDSTHALYLESFIDSLKTRGGVQQVGVQCYNANSPMIGDTLNPLNVQYFDQDWFNDQVHRFSYGLPWNKKIDVLSLDEEFWIPNGTTIQTYGESVNDFHQYHMPMLRAMYHAAKYCPDNYLRVEDFISPSLDINAYIPPYPDTAIYTNKTQSWEMDSIGIYADRILLGSYDDYPQAMWNQDNWIQGDSEMGLNRYHAYYKKEIWPVFSAENYDSGTCTKFAYQPGNDFSGSNLCGEHFTNKAEWIEQQYFDSLQVAEKKQVWNDNVNGAYAQNPMGADTCFQILGSAWYDYRALATEGINFDTITSGSSKGFLRFYVTLGHDTQYVRANDLNQKSIVLSATVHGGKGPFTYFWYDIQTGIPLMGPSSSNSYTLPWSYNTFSYAASQIGVIVRNGGAHDTNVTDYVNVYKYCSQPQYPHSPVRHKGYHAMNNGTTNTVKIYPDPNNGSFKVQTSSTSGSWSVEIFNMFGQIIFTQLNIQTPTYNLALNNQPAGVYFYRVLNDGGGLIGSGKLIIQK